MYNKSKNGLLFAVFILIILLIVSILVLSVYNTRQSDVEEYKISLNNTVYDKNFSYISLDDDAILKKEWDSNYYLYSKNGSFKYDLGTEAVFFDKAKKQVTIYGTVYQVYSNSDVAQKNKKTEISNLEEFQFFKLADRKYLMVGSYITSDGLQTNDYLIVSIDKAGNALLVNDSVNIKTIHPLIISIGNIKFDVANEKLLTGDESIDLKKINGSTNEYIEEAEEEKNDNNKENNQNVTPNTTQNGNGAVNTTIYNDIVRQIINITGLLGPTETNLNLYKNVGLRAVNPGATYINVTYAVIDPEDKYLSVFLSLKDENENVSTYYLSKEVTEYRITGLYPNQKYELSINYITRDSNKSTVADSVVVLTSSDPTVVRITKIQNNIFTYNVKMYNEYEFDNAYVTLTNCNGQPLSNSIKQINKDDALSANGASGEIEIESFSTEKVCLNLVDIGGNIISNSYHKIKIN